MAKPLLPLPTKTPVIDSASIINFQWVAWFDRAIKKINELEWISMVGNKYAASSIATEYTTPPGFTAEIKNFTATNQDVVARTITVHVVLSGATATTANRVVNAFSIPAGEAVVLTDLEGLILSQGDTLQVFASVASKVVIRASAREVA